jgi:hypothetical protein
MSDNVPTTIVSIRNLECIELGPELGCQSIQECLRFGIGVQGRIALGASSRLLAGNVVAVFVINVNTIKLLSVDNVDKASGECFLLTKAVVPTVVRITCCNKIDGDALDTNEIHRRKHTGTSCIDTTYLTKIHPYQHHRN